MHFGLHELVKAGYFPKNKSECGRHVKRSPNLLYRRYSPFLGDANVRFGLHALVEAGYFPKEKSECGRHKDTVRTSCTEDIALSSEISCVGEKQRLLIARSRFVLEFEEAVLFH